MSTTYTDLWVCTDCMLTRETGDTLPDTDMPPWQARSFDFGQISMNIEHDDDGVFTEGYREFADTRCEGCGSTLAGSRWRYAEWDS